MMTLLKERQQLFFQQKNPFQNREKFPSQKVVELTDKFQFSLILFEARSLTQGN